MHSSLSDLEAELDQRYLSGIFLFVLFIFIVWVSADPNKDQVPVVPGGA